MSEDVHEVSREEMLEIIRKKKNITIREAIFKTGMTEFALRRWSSLGRIKIFRTRKFLGMKSEEKISQAELISARDKYEYGDPSKANDLSMG